MIKALFAWLFYDHHRKMEERYYAQSVDLIDLERRQRLVSRGQAPWQVASRIFHTHN